MPKATHFETYVAMLSGNQVEYGFVFFQDKESEDSLFQLTLGAVSADDADSIEQAFEDNRHLAQAIVAAPAPRKHEAPVMMCCKECGSDNVVKDAWAAWNADSQEWELESVFDHTYCNSCEGDANLKEVPLADFEAAQAAAEAE